MDVHRCRFVDYTPHTITSLAFSHPSTPKFAPQDLRLAVGRNNGDIEIWNPKNKWVHEFTLFGSRDQSVEGLLWCVSDGEQPRLFSIGGTTRVTEWDLKTGKVLVEFDCNAAIIWSMAKNESQNKLALGCDDGTVVVLDISGGVGSIEHHAFLQRQDARVLSLCWRGDEQVIGGCADGKIRVWGAESKRLTSTMKVDKSKTESTLVWCVMYLPHQAQIVSGDSTGSIKFWDFAHSTLLQSFKVHEADVLTLACDLSNETVFTAGVDRKIYKFQLAEQHKQQRWTNVSNRLFHSNDIRSIATFESKNLNFLISAGVEKNIVISSLKNFTDGQYRKLSIVPQQQHLLVNKEQQRLVVMWQEQTVKVWKLLKKTVEDDESDVEMDDVEELRDSYELVAKLTLADDQNISTCALSQDGTLLAVGRVESTRLFRLSPKPNCDKLQVSKVSLPSLGALGSRILNFYGNEHIIVVAPDNEIYKVSLNDQVTEIELSELPRSKSKLAYTDNVAHTVLTHSKLIVCRSGALDIVDLESLQASPLLRLSSYIVRLGLSPNKNALCVITHENKLYEFDLSTSHLTAWSRANSEFLPREFLELSDSPLGILHSGSKLWVYSSSWLAVFDMEMNVTVEKKDKKRHRSGGLIGHSAVEEADESDDEIEVETNMTRSDITNEKEGIPFQLVKKYKNVLHASVLSDDELLVVERPQSALKQPPAFKLAQYRV